MSRPRVGPSFSKGIAERPKYASVRELNSHPRERPCKTLKKKAVPSEILVKEIYIPDCKISLACFVPYLQEG